MSDELNLEPIKERMERAYIFIAEDGMPAIDGGKRQGEDLKALLAEVYRQRELIGMLESDLETYRALTSNLIEKGVLPDDLHPDTHWELFERREHD